MLYDDEFDRSKSDWTKKHRGIDFIEAREIWNDPNKIEDAPANVIGGENRWLVVGRALGKIWTVCYTYRNSKIRIISVRPSREDEREINAVL